MQPVTNASRDSSLAVSAARLRVALRQARWEGVKRRWSGCLATAITSASERLNVGSNASESEGLWPGDFSQAGRVPGNVDWPVGR